jgi:RNA polymerase sigma-70 factor (sigma-E family)
MAMTFDEFANSRLPSLLRFAKVLCIDRGLAEDVVQEVLLRAHRKWASIGSLDHPEQYVRRMIVNEHLSWRRKWSRIVVDADVHAVDADDPGTQISDRSALMSEIAALPKRQRTVLVLRYYGGLTDEEIARDMGCATGTVRSHASRGLAALRVQFNVDRVAEEA